MADGGARRSLQKCVLKSLTGLYIRMVPSSSHRSRARGKEKEYPTYSELATLWTKKAASKQSLTHVSAAVHVPHGERLDSAALCSAATPWASRCTFVRVLILALELAPSVRRGLDRGRCDGLLPLVQHDASPCAAFEGVANEFSRTSGDVVAVEYNLCDALKTPAVQGLAELGGRLRPDVVLVRVQATQLRQRAAPIAVLVHQQAGGEAFAGADRVPAEVEPLQGANAPRASSSDSMADPEGPSRLSYRLSSRSFSSAATLLGAACVVMNAKPSRLPCRGDCRRGTASRAPSARLLRGSWGAGPTSPIRLPLSGAER